MRLTHRPDLRALVLGTALGGCSSNPASDEAPPTLVAAAFTDAQTIRLTFSEPVADPSAVNTDAFRLSIGVKDVESTVYYALDYEGLYDDTATSGGGGPITDGDPTADPTIVDPSDPTTGDPTVDPTDATTDATTDPTVDPTDTYDPTGGYDASDPDGGYDGGYVEPSDELPFTQSIPTLPIMDLDIASIVPGADAKQIDLKLAVSVTDTYACDALADLATDSTKLGIFVHYKPGANTIVDTAGNPLAAIAPHWVDKRSVAYTELQGDFPQLDPYLPIPCP